MKQRTVEALTDRGAKRRRTGSRFRNSVHICHLGDRPEVIPVVAEWIYREWSFFYVGKTSHYVENIFRKRQHKKKLPLTLVAFDKDNPVGTVSLKEFEMAGRKKLRYWVTSLYVVESARGHGIGEALMKSAEEKATHLGIERLYLFTADRRLALRFYKPLGWKIAESTSHRGYEIVILKKDISAGARAA